MNHMVPEFDDCVNVNQISSSSSSLNHQSIMGQEDDLMELLWHEGQVVLHHQKPIINVDKPSSSSVGGGGGEVAPPPPLHQHQPLDQNLFIHEDEMTSWLHYPLRDNDILLPASAAVLPAPSAPTSESQTMTQVTASLPPVLSVRRTENAPRPPVRNFMNFSRLRGNFTGGNSRGESAPSTSKAIVRESTQVKSSDTPAAEAIESGLIRRTDDIDSRKKVTFGSSSAVGGGDAYSFAIPGNNLKGKAVAAECEIPGASSSVKVNPETEKTIIIDDRKRKEREANDEAECRIEETKQACGLTSTKRSRAAQVHNLSERKRRDRINERMKALQELIPRCNKSDKASMLDEAIDYMKSLQLQIQMMSMGCGMMPMMYSGMQKYMPHMAMGMNQPPSFMPFPNMLATQRPLPTQTHIGGSVFSGPNHYPVLASDPSRVCVQNQQSDPTSSQPQYSGYIDPYQQLRSPQPTQAPQFQNQATSHPTSSRVSNSKESKDQGKDHTTG